MRLIPYHALLIPISILSQSLTHIQDEVNKWRFSLSSRNYPLGVLRKHVKISSKPGRQGKTGIPQTTSEIDKTPNLSYTQNICDGYQQSREARTEGDESEEQRARFVLISDNG